LRRLFIGLFQSPLNEGPWVNISPVGVAEVFFSVSVVFNSNGFCNFISRLRSPKRRAKRARKPLTLPIHSSVVCHSSVGCLFFVWPSFGFVWPKLFITFWPFFGLLVSIVPPFMVYDSRRLCFIGHLWFPDLWFAAPVGVMSFTCPFIVRLCPAGSMMIRLLLVDSSPVYWCFIRSALVAASKRIHGGTEP
jgi:hypothetical protein